jgi:hypothetical protein
MERSEGNIALKNPVTSPGIDPATARLVAQRLNHYATAGPSVWDMDIKVTRQSTRKCGKYLLDKTAYYDVTLKKKSSVNFSTKAHLNP